MKFFAALTALLLIVPGTSAAICVRSTDYTIEDETKNAAIVFVATITEARIARGSDGLPAVVRRGSKWAYYTVQYKFEVAIPIKGDPTQVPFLTTAGLWKDPKEMKFSVQSEQAKFVPGDSVLVITKSTGEVPISEIGCTPSMPWGPEARELLRKAQLLPT